MQESGTLAETIRREINDPMVGQAGVHIIDLATGEAVFSHNPDHVFPLASLTKIFTVGAALEVIGEGATFTTRFFSDGPVKTEGTLEGNLFVQAGGDPTIGDNDYVEGTFSGNGTSVSRIAEALHAVGIRRVAGQLVVDGSLFATEGNRRTDWIAALTFNRQKSANPLRDSGQTMMESLAKEGFLIQGGFGGDNPVPKDAVELATTDSPTVKDLSTHAGHESDNFVSEILTKHIGARQSAAGVGSTAAGCAAIEDHAKRRGADIDLINGSGLRRTRSNQDEGNHGTVKHVVKYLRELPRQPFADGLAASLPRAASEGTLEVRMRNTPAVGRVRAKTGTLTLDRKPLQDSLAGYITGSHVTLAFALIYKGAASRYVARASLDRIVAAAAARV